MDTGLGLEWQKRNEDILTRLINDCVGKQKDIVYVNVHLINIPVRGMPGLHKHTVGLVLNLRQGKVSPIDSSGFGSEEHFYDSIIDLFKKIAPSLDVTDLQTSQNYKCGRLSMSQIDHPGLCRYAPALMLLTNMQLTPQNMMLAIIHFWVDVAGFPHDLLSQPLKDVIMASPITQQRLASVYVWWNALTECLIYRLDAN